MKTILLVEDEALLAMAERLTIGKWGYEVLTAGTGEEAIEALHRRPDIDLVLMDIDLGPEIDGTEAARRILEGRAIPIVFLTSHAEREMVEKVRGITRYGYVIKNSGDFVLQSSIEMAFELFDANRKVAEREARYRLLADNISDVLWILDLQTGRWDYVSPSVERLRGYTVEEVMDRPPEEMKPPGSFAYAEEQSQGLVPRAAGGDTRKMENCTEFEQVRKDGSTVWTEVRTRVAYGNGGEPILIGITRDIDERKKAESALLESDARFRKVLHDVETIAVQGYAPDGTTLYWNRASESVYGYTEAEALGRNLLELIIPPEMREAVAGAMRMMAETGTPIPSSELSLMRKDGSRVDVYSSHAIVKVPGRGQELFCLDIDLAGRRRA